ncbi:MAG: hypothetical protein O2807_10550, partial [bacterium]|nr:hypothetical protein [bacterium]
RPLLDHIRDKIGEVFRGALKPTGKNKKKTAEKKVRAFYNWTITILVIMSIGLIYFSAKFSVSEKYTEKTSKAVERDKNNPQIKTKQPPSEDKKAKQERDGQMK